MSTPKAFIFDCDGTLLDSMGMWLGIQPELLARYGFSLTPSDFARFEHLSLEEECHAYHDVWGIGESGDAVYAELESMLRDRYATQIEARSGVRAFLDEARAAGIPMCIATSTPSHLVYIGLEHNGMAGYFSGITTTAEAPRPKGFPDIYDLALSRLRDAHLVDDCNPCDVWVFEDALFGLTGAGAGGYRRVGIFDPSGRSARPDVMTNCELFVDEFEELALADILAYGGL